MVYMKYKYINIRHAHTPTKTTVILHYPTITFLEFSFFPEIKYQEFNAKPRISDKIIKQTKAGMKPKRKGARGGWETGK